MASVDSKDGVVVVVVESGDDGIDRRWASVNCKPWINLNWGVKRIEIRRVKGGQQV